MKLRGRKCLACISMIGGAALAPNAIISSVASLHPRGLLDGSLIPALRAS